MTLEPHHIKSLKDAGIGSVYHERTLDGCGKNGAVLKDYFTSGKANEMRDAGQSLILRGFSRSEVAVFAKTLHMNGLGVRALTVSQLYATLRAGGERLEDVGDCRALVLRPAQTNKPSPMSAWQTDIIEDYLLTRAGDARSVVLCFDGASPEEPWWTDAFTEEMRALSIVLVGDRWEGGA